jgi:hypothetical protein
MNAPDRDSDQPSRAAEGSAARGPAGAGRGRARWRVPLGLLLGAVVLAGLGEAAARWIVGLGDPPLYRTDPELGYLMVPGTYRRFGHTIHYNRFHMRGPDVPERRTRADELRLLVMGDSVVNGGAPTDDADLATVILARRLGARLGAPVQVMNVSAGSWSPGNLLAYLRRFGTFDADLVVLVYNSLDWGEVVHSDLGPEQPTTRPWLALQEAVTNYAPRLLARVGLVRTPPDAVTPDPARAEQSLAAIRETVALLRQRGVPVVAVQHLRWSETIGTPLEGHARIAGTLHELGVETIQAADAFRLIGPTAYRDDIHPNAKGQEVLARVLEMAVRAGLPGRLPPP